MLHLELNFCVQSEQLKAQHELKVFFFSSYHYHGC